MKKFLSLFLILIYTLLSAQSNKARWQDLFSYNNVILIEEIEGELYCGTENGIFVYHPDQDEFLKLNKTNVLNQVGISSFEYNPSTKDLFIGYDNGSIDIYNIESKKTKIVLDIPWNRYNGDKKINDILIKKDIALIAGSFGVVSYDIKSNQFIETTFFSENGQYKEVKELALLNNILYALNNEKLYSISLSSNGTNSPDFQKWTKTILGNENNFSNIAIVGSDIYVSNPNKIIKINTNLQIQEVAKDLNIRDIKSLDNKLIIIENNQIKSLNPSDTKYLNIKNNQNERVLLNTAIFYKDNFYGGSQNYGLVKFVDNSIGSQFDEEKDKIAPDGPFNNQSYSVTAKNQKVWITIGGTDGFAKPLELDAVLYHFDSYKWKNYTNNELSNSMDAIGTVVNPKDENEIYVTTFSGGKKFEHGILKYNKNVDQFETISNRLLKYRRFYGGTFDELGNAYFAQSFVDGIAGQKDYNVTNLLVKSSTNQWSNYIIDNGDPAVALNPIVGYKNIYMPQARTGGLIIFNKSNPNEKLILKNANASLPTNDIRTVALDSNNVLWIGSSQGLVVLRDAENIFQTNSYQTEPIIITQNGIPEALLTSIRINSIKVDKANRKWIATNSSGVYYVSDNGSQTINHFTSKNSPLPSDIVYDIAIDDTTGKVYFATEKGVVSFGGDVQEIGGNFNKAMVYPNPVRPGFNGNVTIKNLPERASVKITDIVGNLLFEAKASGGIVEWDTKNNKGKYVASGVYLVLMTNTDGTETKTLKIAVVR